MRSAKDWSDERTTTAEESEPTEVCVCACVFAWSWLDLDSKRHLCDQARETNTTERSGLRNDRLVLVQVLVFPHSQHWQCDQR